MFLVQTGEYRVLLGRSKRVVEAVNPAITLFVREVGVVVDGQNVGGSSSFRWGRASRFAVTVKHFSYPVLFPTVGLPVGEYLLPDDRIGDGFANLFGLDCIGGASKGRLVGANGRMIGDRFCRGR